MATVSKFVRLLKPTEALSALQKSVPLSVRKDCFAMYSSELDGITTDPSLYVVPIDDHMTTRGHAVFDTCNVVDGNAYGLQFHLDRLLKSAEAAKICDDQHPLRFSKQRLQNIVLSTIAATGRKNGVYVRYWLSVGRGDFSISPSGLRSRGGKANFYCVAHQDYDSHKPQCEIGSTGLKACTTTLPLKPPLLSSTKTTNYLINALIQMEADDKNVDLAIQVDSKKQIYESSVSCIAMVDKDGVLCVPRPGHILESTTAARAFSLAPALISNSTLNSTVRRDFSIEEIKECRELLDIGGGWIRPITELDGTLIGNGLSGPVACGLEMLLMEDMKTYETLKIPYEQFFEETEITSFEG
eukprot:GSMAST32.ASY1.ANO1.96.1 assembled CDS